MRDLFEARDAGDQGEIFPTQCVSSERPLKGRPTGFPEIEQHENCIGLHSGRASRAIPLRSEGSISGPQSRIITNEKVAGCRNGRHGYRQPDHGGTFEERSRRCRGWLRGFRGAPFLRIARASHPVSPKKR